MPVISSSATIAIDSQKPSGLMKAPRLSASTTLLPRFTTSSRHVLRHSHRAVLRISWAAGSWRSRGSNSRRKGGEK